MKEPIIERIARNVEETLKGITTSNGYHYDLTVERMKRRGNIPAHLKAVLYQLDPDEGEELLARDNWNQPFAIDVCVMPAEEDETPVDTYLNRVFADIATALLTDVTRGGYCVDTKIHAPVHFSDVNGELEGLTFQFEVQYRTAWNDPFTLRT